MIKEISPKRPSEDCYERPPQPTAPVELSGRAEATQALIPLETLLIRDIIYVFQGLSGTYIKYEETAKQISVKLSADSQVRGAEELLILQLCEVGVLYKKIKQIIRQRLNMEAVDSKTRDEAGAGRQRSEVQLGDGMTVLSFCAVIHQELAEYLKALTELETELVKDMERSREASPTLPSSGGHEGHSPRAGRPSLTLLRLRVWLQQPLKLLKLIHRLLVAVDGLKGGHFLSAVYAFTRTGDPQVRAFIEKILVRATEPLFTYVKQWITVGKLVDPFHEFFIDAQTEGGFSKEDFWDRQYALNEDNVPSFLTSELAKLILDIGKTINFSTKFCERTGCSSVLSSASQMIREAPDVNGGISETKALAYVPCYSSLDAQKRSYAMLSTVRAISLTTNATLLHLVKTEHQLLRHLFEFKQVVLLTNGEFAQVLMEQLFDYLSKPADQIQKHQLLGALDTAVRTLTTHMDSAAAPEVSSRAERGGSLSLLEDLGHRLTVNVKSLQGRGKQATQLQTGWDVFSLKIHVQPPISIVLGDKAVERYETVFALLWKIKRVEYALNRVWRNHIFVHHYKHKLLQNCKQVNVLFTQSHMLRAEMVSFVSNLQSYVIYEVIEASWSTLAQALAGADSFDAILQSHTAYLSRIAEKLTFSHRSSPSSRDQLEECLDVVLHFCTHQQRLFSAVLGVINRCLTLEERIRARTKQGNWGLNYGEDEEHLIELEKEDAAIKDEFRGSLSLIKEDFRTQFQSFLRILHTHTDSETLMMLTNRFDFNHFYTG